MHGSKCALGQQEQAERIRIINNIVCVWKERKSACIETDESRMFCGLLRRVSGRARLCSAQTAALQRVRHVHRSGLYRRSILAAEFGLSQVEHKGMEVVGRWFNDLYWFLAARL